MSDLHSALKTSIDARFSHNGFDFLRACLQNGKDKFEYTLHVRPTMFSTAGMQRTDFLKALGFSRQTCAFHAAEAYCLHGDAESDVEALAKAIGTAFPLYELANQHLEACGFGLSQPEGWGYFYGKPSGRGRNHSHGRCSGNGHVSPKVESMKSAEDEHFQFAMTWIEGGNDKGWTIHYRPKHMPMSQDFSAALNFIGGFTEFGECPEFGFDSCWWRFTEFRNGGESFFDSNAEYAHRCFDAHVTNFSLGIRNLLEANAIVRKVGLHLLPLPKAVRYVATQPAQTGIKLRPSTAMNISKGSAPAVQQSDDSGFKYDVAFSFAGTEREIVEIIATRVRDAGFDVFYDNFYPEQLWGEDLAALFDRIYRREARFCAMFVSREYAERIWTTHERRSATARALAERGAAYILPVYVEQVDIDGLPPTLGHISLAERSADDVADLLIRKLSSRELG